MKIQIIYEGEKYNKNLALLIRNILIEDGVEISIVTPDKCNPSYDGFVLIVPEWNGTFPWTFKKFIDDAGYPNEYKDKLFTLIGTSAGPFGNIVGLNQLTTVLYHIHAKVHNMRTCVNNIKQNIFLSEYHQMIIEQMYNFKTVLK